MLGNGDLNFTGRLVRRAVNVLRSSVDQSFTERLDGRVAKAGEIKLLERLRQGLRVVFTVKEQTLMLRYALFLFIYF